MEHPEDLYLLDAEQAVRELAVYLDGTSNYQSHRIIATINYLATLLRTLGMDHPGLAGERLVEALEQLDEGQGRRLIREFTESTQGALDAVRKGSPQPEGDERLDRLLERLSPLTPQPEGTPHFDWGPREAERDLLSHAFKAIQAADSFAAILSRETRPAGFSGGHIPVAEAPQTTAGRANPWQGSGWDVQAPLGEPAGPEVRALSTQTEGGRGLGYFHPLAPHEPPEPPKPSELPESLRSSEPPRSPELPRSPEPPGSPSPPRSSEPPRSPEPHEPLEPLGFDPLKSGGYSTHPDHAEPGEQPGFKGHLEPGEQPELRERLEPGERGERLVRVVSSEPPALKAIAAEAERPKSVAPEAPGVLKPPLASITSGSSGPRKELPIESARVGDPRSAVAAPAPSAKATRRRRATAAASATTPTAASAAHAQPSTSAEGSLSTPGQIVGGHDRNTLGETYKPANPANSANPANHANSANPADRAATTQPAATPLSESPGSGSAPQASAPGTLAVDAAFRAALRLADESAWARGMGSLLESIDALDHQPLAGAFPSQLTLQRGNELQCQSELVRALGSALATLPCSGVAEASLAGTTLAVVVELERVIAATPLARLVAHFHGRIEVDRGRQRWQILVPSSARLLRVMPLRLEEYWIAVSWAQYLGLDIATQREAQLRIGEEADRLRVVEAGAAVVGVRFDLDPAFRRRERYRGVVLTPASQWLPIYA